MLCMVRLISDSSEPHFNIPIRFLFRIIVLDGRIDMYLVRLTLTDPNDHKISLK